MLNDLIGKEKKIELYLMAGLATAPQFLEEFRLAFLKMLEQHGTAAGSIHSGLLFPYGDWNRRIIPQLWEIRTDMRLGIRRLSKSKGGNRAFTAILAQQTHSCDRSRTKILVGHSGGGIAAVHAAQLLSEHEGSSVCAVMIGSPRCRVPEGLRPSVLSIRAAGTSDRGFIRGRSSPDLVSRMGSYGGWVGGTWQRISMLPLHSFPSRLSVDMPTIFAIMHPM